MDSNFCNHNTISFKSLDPHLLSLLPAVQTNIWRDAFVQKYLVIDQNPFGINIV